MTWTHGAHNVKFGGGVIYRQFSLVQSPRPRGEFTFNNAQAATDFSFASFTLGNPVQVQRAAALYKPGYRSWEPGFYVQDDWRATRWLTLNLGIRYDIYTPKSEQYNRLANWDPVNNQMLVAGENAGSTAGVNTDHGNVAPRLGFATTLGHGMVLRGGWGISYFPGDYTSGAALKNLPFTFALSCGPLSNAVCPAGTGAFSQGVPRPIESSDYVRTGGVVDLTKIPPSSLTTMDLNFQASRMQQFNVLFEKQFGSNVITAGYVGMRGGDLVMALPDINRPLPSTTAIPRPLAALYPALTGISYQTTNGSSEYNSIQLNFNRRLTRGLGFTSGYTYARGSDNITGLGTGTGGYGNFAGPNLAQAIANTQVYDWASSDFNIRSRFTFGGNYDIPFGKSLKGPAGLLVAGWQLNGTFGWQTGLPLTVTDQTAVAKIAGLGGGGERPDLTGQNLIVDSPTVGSNGQYLNPAAFANPASGTLGNAPRNVTFGPRQSVINMSLFKNFAFKERYNVQLRAETFNLPNHPVFDRPAFNNFGNANFGRITSLAPGYAMRQIQFGLKFLF